jgi:hypothetical protein
VSFGRGRNKKAFCFVRSGPDTPKLAGDNREANDFGLVVAAVVTPLALSLSKQLPNSRQALGLEPVEQPSDDGCYENGKAWIWQIPGS